MRAARRAALEVAALAFAASRSVLAGRFEGRAAVRQAYEFGNRSVFFLAVTMGFVGMIMVFQGCFQARRLIGDYSMVGPAFLQLLVREFAPTIGALMLATRIGSGIAAELGSMAVTEQVDALRMCGADPVDALVAPRLVASVAMTLALTALSALFAEAAGLFTARTVFGVASATFTGTFLVVAGDIATGLVKSLCFGTVIPLLSAWAGLRARGGSEGVGNATTLAVLSSSLSIIALDFAINVAFYPLYSRA